MTRYTIQLEQRRQLSENCFLLRFSRPADFDFTPGQFVRFTDHQRLRDYTLVNGPRDDCLEICVRLLPGGHFTPALIQAPLGQTFEVDGPMGYFHFEATEQAAVFIATGTGIAPFVAFARAGVGGFTMLHGVGKAGELYFRETLQASAGRYVACLSAPDDGRPLPPWACRQRVTDYLQTTLTPGAYQFYLCGSAAMIRDAILIIDERFAGAPIFTETFY
jgi:ferredoxin-NADP reductase